MIATMFLAVALLICAAVIIVALGVLALRDASLAPGPPSTRVPATGTGGTAAPPPVPVTPEGRAAPFPPLRPIPRDAVCEEVAWCST